MTALLNGRDSSTMDSTATDTRPSVFEGADTADKPTVDTSAEPTIEQSTEATPAKRKRRAAPKATGSEPAPAFVRSTWEPTADTQLRAKTSAVICAAGLAERMRIGRAATEQLVARLGEIAAGLFLAAHVAEHAEGNFAPRSEDIVTRLGTMLGDIVGKACAEAGVSVWESPTAADLGLVAGTAEG